MTNYKPIPIYDSLEWDLTTEACHTILLAPSGAGKTIFLSYLSAMLLKRGHKLYIIDAKIVPSVQRSVVQGFILLQALKESFVYLLHLSNKWNMIMKPSIN